MKKSKIFLITNLIFAIITQVFIIKADMGMLVPFLPSDKSETLNFVDTIEKRLKSLESDKTNLITKDNIAKRIDSLNNEIVALRDKLRYTNVYEQSFLQDKITIFNQKYQILIELDQVQQQCMNILEEHIKLLTEYKDDPDFKKLKVPVKAYYTFDDLQELSSRRFDYDEKLSALEEKKQSNLVDLNNRKKAQAIVAQEYKERKKQQEDFVSKLRKGSSGSKMHLQDQGVILDENEKLWSIKKELADLKATEDEFKESLIRSQIEIAVQQAALVKNEYERVKKIIRVDENSINQSNLVLEKSRQDALSNQERAQEKIRVIMAVKNNFKGQIAALIKEFDLSPAEVNSISDWSLEPKTLTAWGRLCSLGNFANHNTLLDIQKDYLDAQIDFEKTKFKQEELKNKILKSWHKMTSGSFELSNDEEIDQEIKSYNTLKSEFSTDLASNVEKKNSSLHELNSLNAVFEKLRSKIKAISYEKDTIFKEHYGEYAECLARLNNAEEQMKTCIESISKVAETYSSNILIINSCMKKIDNVIAELSTKSFWRSANEALFNRIVNFIPDIELFFKDLTKISLKRISKFSFTDLAKNIYTYLARPVYFLYFLIFLILSLGLFFLGLRYLPDLRLYIFDAGQKYPSITSSANVMVLLLDFVITHFKSLYSWLVLFLAFRFSGIFSPYYSIIFYLGSIVYLIYMIGKFIEHLVHANESRGYIILHQGYQRRFIIVVSGLLYGTAILQLFRLAFLLGNYPHSDVPTVLIAINFIILQVSLIFLIGREQILSIVPLNTPLWEWVHEHIKKYYYLFVAFIVIVIIMSNPYVGFGRQVFYFLSRILITLLLFPIFSFVQNIFKRGASDLFFYNDGEVVKERFNSSKSWYGLFVISMFIFFAAVGFIIAAKIWGNSITLNDMSDLINKELPIAGYDASGKRIEVTPFSFFKIFMFVATGIFIAYIVNRFILQRIFTLLLVSTGIQSMLLTLTRYFIVILALLIGIQNAGMSSTLWYIAALAGGIAFAMKEPVSDVISYFIILVQRPIKIGDYIMVDDHISGVVRHITPRSVMLRKKNSVTIVVPNSHFIVRPVFNWNVSRSFFAFNDILITVPYNLDPAKVKEIMLKVLTSNPHVLKNPPPIVQLNDFTENGFLFLIRGFLSPDKVLEQWEISSEIRFELVKLMKKNGIEIAQPTRILRVTSGSMPNFEDKV